MRRQRLSSQPIEPACLDIALDLPIPGVGVVIREPLAEPGQLLGCQLRDLALERLDLAHAGMIPVFPFATVSQPLARLDWPSAAA